MEPHENGSAPGGSATLLGDPSRLILLGYYDGPTEGVIEFEGGRSFHFEMPNEEHQLSNRSLLREYTFTALPAGSVDRLETVLAEHLTPCRPIWNVNWVFPSAAAESRTNEQVSGILSQAAAPAWAVTLPANWSFENFHPVRVVALQSA